MKADSRIKIKHCADAIFKSDATHISNEADSIQHFIKDSDIAGVLAKALSVVCSQEAIELALDTTEIQSAISDLTFDFAKRVVCITAAIEANELSITGKED